MNFSILEIYDNKIILSGEKYIFVLYWVNNELDHFTFDCTLRLSFTTSILTIVKQITKRNPPPIIRSVTLTPLIPPPQLGRAFSCATLRLG